MDIVASKENQGEGKAEGKGDGKKRKGPWAAEAEKTLLVDIHRLASLPSFVRLLSLLMACT